jgi:lipopolysaccharide biosynthesis protein
LPSFSDIAIVIHIYYEDTWVEIAAILLGLNHDFDLIVTIPSNRDRLADKIRCDFPHADILALENRGRDVRPFLVLLEQGRLDRYRYVCKIHGKKSHDGGRLAILGAIWRNRMLFDLLAAPNALNAIVEHFDRHPDVGMIGSAAYRYPSNLCSLKVSWGKNRPLVLKIAKCMGINSDQFRLDFFCGSMFWVRPEALRPLKDLKLAGTFPSEMGELDGTLEHAVERLFSTATVVAGYRIEGVDGVYPLPCPLERSSP